MKTGILLGVAVTSIALLAAGCGVDDTSSGVDLDDKTFDVRTSQSDVEVDAIDNAFDPAYVEISTGTTVTFRNDGRNQHNVLPVDEGSFEPVEADAFEPGATVSITFDDAGDYPYYCSLHGTTTRGMIGGIRVVE